MVGSHDMILGLGSSFIGMCTIFPEDEIKTMSQKLKHIVFTSCLITRYSTSAKKVMCSAFRGKPQNRLRELPKLRTDIFTPSTPIS